MRVYSHWLSDGAQDDTIPDLFEWSIGANGSVGSGLGPLGFYTLPDAT